MKHLFILVLIVFTVPALTAQFDYQLFRPDVQYLYENYSIESSSFRSFQSETDSPIVGMKTDERECQDLYRTISSWQCQPGPSFAGYKICQSPDATIMHMGERDSFRLETQALLGDSWTAGLMDNIVVTGRVTDVDTMSFLGLLDSVKTISFFHSEADTLFSLPVIISKNYGLVSCVRLGARRGGLRASPLTLLGMSEPEVGLQNYTDEEVFDLQAGDKFHIYENHNLDGYDAGRLLVEIVSVERTENRVKINYSGERISSTTIFRDGEFVEIVVQVEEVNSSWTSSQFMLEMLRKQPGEFYPMYEGFEGTYVVAQMFPANLCGLHGKRASVEMYQYENRECLFNTEATDGTPSYFFYPGLGNSFGEIHSVISYERTLQYANTSTLECGEPYVIGGTSTSFLQTPGSTSFNVYPNPVSDELHFLIEEPGDFSFSVLDQLGRTFMKNETVSGSGTINTAGLPSGIYHLLLFQEGQLMGRKRLIIE